ncbi:MAG: DUF1579 family protein [Anaeromyxobacteraceae bacterium]
MTRRLLTAAIAASTLLAAAAAHAEDKAPRPGPDHARLGFFVGKWKTTGVINDSPFMPGGKFTETSDCQWFSGNFSVVCRTKGKGPAGPMEAMAIMGWSGEEKVYVFYGVESNPMAWATVPRGTYADGTWTFEDESRMGGQMVKSRYVIKQVDGKGYTSTWSILGQDGQWKVLMEATSKRA